MDPGLNSSLIDFFKRGGAAKDVKLLAADGAFAPRADEQLALLVLLSDDPDPEVAARATATIEALPAGALKAFLGRADVPQPMKDFFAARGVTPDGAPAAAQASEPMPEAAPPDAPEAIASTGDEQEEGDEEDEAQALSSLPIVDRMKIAVKGSRTQRAMLIRDPNKLVSAAVLSSPKLTESEVEAFAKMGNVSEEVLRSIGTNRAWTKNYTIISALARNPKTPPAIAMQMVQRLNDRDMKALASDRNVPESVRLIAKKFVVKAMK